MVMDAEIVILLWWIGLLVFDLNSDKYDMKTTIFIKYWQFVYQKKKLENFDLNNHFDFITPKLWQFFNLENWKTVNQLYRLILTL